MSRIAIVGGGMAGLTAAYTLGKSGRCQVTLLEASGRLGGKVQTHIEDGLLIEQGPDSVFSMKPAAVELMDELGLQDEIIGPKGSEFSILVGGTLHPVPRALATLMPTASGVLEKVGFLSAAAKRRVLSERSAPKGTGGDESVASFFRRRFGRKFSSLVAEPLLGGIHAGDPQKLSMKALYPSYLGLEQKNGSLTGVASPHPAPSHVAKRPAFVALKGGMAKLVDRLEERLEGVEVLKGAHATGIAREGDGLVLRYSTVPAGPASLSVNALILAVPAYAAASLLREIAPETARGLAAIRYVSTAIVSLAFPAEAFPNGLHGNGFLVPYDEPCDITGCTWSSIKWDGRAPDGTILMRLFMGLDGRFDVDEHTDDDLLAKAANAIRTIAHPCLPPTHRRIDRWQRAMPQYEVGHLDRLAEAESGLSGLPIILAGSSYRGNGIPDCVRQGREAANRILQEHP